MSSYSKKTWTNRSSEYPYRRTLTNVNDSSDVKTVDVTRAEGAISTQGDVFDANTMNNMENRIDSAFSTVDQAMGDLNNLTTQEKSSLVGAINEVAAGGGGGGSSTLAGLTDTDISSPTNGQVLKYNSTSSKWVNAAESGGGSSNYLVFTYTNSNNAWSFTSVVDQTGTAVLEADVYTLLSDGYDAYVDLVYPTTGGTGRALLKSIYRRGSTLFILGFGEFKQYAETDYIRGRVELTIHENDTSSSDWTFDFSKAKYDAYDVNYDNSSHTSLAGTVEGAIGDLDDHKANLASPAFTGNPTAPTQSAGNNSTRIATTAFVQAAKNTGLDTKDQSSSAVSVPSSTSSWTQVSSQSLTAGIWMIIATVNYAKQTTTVGYRAAMITNQSNPTSANMWGTVIIPAVENEVTRTQVAVIVQPTQTTTYYLFARQNSNASINVTSRMTYIKLSS